MPPSFEMFSFILHQSEDDSMLLVRNAKGAKVEGYTKDLEKAPMLSVN